MRQKTCDNILIQENRELEGYSYTYELILRKGIRTHDWGLPLYSIKVSMTDNNGRKSQSEATDVFTDRKRAEGFFHKLVRNLATPIDLGYVVEDEVLS